MRLDESSAILVIRPVAPSSRGLDHYITALQQATGFDAFTLRQHLVGEGVRVLSTGDETKIRTARQALHDHGVPSAVVMHRDVLRGPAPLVFNKAEWDSANKALTLSGCPVSQPVRLTAGSSGGLMTLGSLEPEQYDSAGLAIAIMLGTGAAAERARARELLLESHHPVLSLFIDPAGPPIQFAAGRINLVEDGTPFTGIFARRFARLKELVQSLIPAPLNVDFGLRALVYGPLAEQPTSPDACLRLFNVYSRLLWLAVQAGLDAAPPAAAAVHLALIPKVIEKGEAEAADANAAELLLGIGAAAERPPQQDSGSKWLRWARRVGPLALVLPLAGVAVVGTFVFLKTLDFTAAYLALAAGGALNLLFGVTTAWWRRTMADLPTSKIRSLAMGPVELKGRSRSRQPLTSPVTRQPCVYYEVEYYRIVQDAQKGNSHRSLESRIDSSLVPFYLADGPDVVLLDPSDAIIQALERNETGSTMLEVLTGTTQSTRFIVELVLPEERDLYVLGFARPNALAPGGKGPGGANADAVIVGAAPFGGPLIITNKSEEEVLESYRLASLGFGGFGLVLLFYAITKLVP